MRSAPPSSASYSGAQYSVAIITTEHALYGELRRFLAPRFRIIPASNESQIQALFHMPDLHGVVFDLDSIGDGALDGIEVLPELKIRQDLIIVATTRSTDPVISAKARDAGD